MFESCRAHFAVPEEERRVARNLDAHVPQADDVVSVSHGARHPSDDLVAEDELGVVLRNLGAVDLEHAQRAIHPAAVVLARDRLLAGVAALLEVDRRPVEARLRRQDTIVELVAEARSSRLVCEGARAPRRLSRPTPASLRPALRRPRRRTRGSRSRRGASHARPRARRRDPPARSRPSRRTGFAAARPGAVRQARSR